jgi:ribosomal protein L7/L12
VSDRETLLRISALEAKVDHLMRHLTGAEGAASVVPPLPSGESTASPRVLEMIRDGDKIGAAKQYRAETGADLATAHSEVEKLSG